MFTEYHVIQFILQYPITKNWRPICTHSSLYSKLCYWTVLQYKLFIIQSTINNSHYNHNTHHNVLLP